MNDLYVAVTKTIIEQLEQGTVPWTRPWKNGNKGGVMPHNAVTNRPYSGINILILWGRGYQSQGWLTYKQAQAAGAQVKKGEKGTRVVFSSPLMVKDKDDETKERKIWLLKSFTVFNTEQIDGLTEEEEDTTPPETRHKAAHAFIEATGAKIRHGGDRACYSPATDVITLPPLSAFQDEENYLATATHELVHWTGTRLDRKCGRRGTQDYAFEELVAELGSAFLCAELHITGELQHASYIASWVLLLKHDPRALFRAASQASKAVEYINTLQPAH